MLGHWHAFPRGTAAFSGAQLDAGLCRVGHFHHPAGVALGPTLSTVMARSSLGPCREGSQTVARAFLAELEGPKLPSEEVRR
jgi:hypothetical protein